LKRALNRESAELIAQQLVRAAVSGDIQATRLIFDRVDHPLGGPLAVAMAKTVQLPASTEPQAHRIMDSNEDRPLAHLSKERLREIIALCPSALPPEARMRKAAVVAPAFSEDHEADPVAELSNERLREIIAMVPEVAALSQPEPVVPPPEP
jgi:hypothetical protein